MSKIIKTARRHLWTIPYPQNPYTVLFYKNLEIYRLQYKVNRFFSENLRSSETNIQKFTDEWARCHPEDLIFFKPFSTKHLPAIPSPTPTPHEHGTSDDGNDSETVVLTGESNSLLVRVKGTVKISNAEPVGFDTIGSQ